MPKLLMGGPHPHQNIASLLDISGHLQRIFHIHPQASPLDCSLVMLLCGTYHASKDVMLSTGASLSGLGRGCRSIHDSFSQCLQLCNAHKIPASIGLLSILTSLDSLFCAEMWRLSFPQYEPEAYSGHWFIAISVP